MITSPWDRAAAAILVAWLPGVENGNGIARALFNADYEASGRLPFTFPKCIPDACSRQDEAASVALGSWLTGDKSYLTFSDRGLFGYRYYHAKHMEVSFPFGHGLFAYGSATVQYTQARAQATNGTAVLVSATLLQPGPRAGAEVPQLYVAFPDSIPGPDAAKPEWRLKGFRKLVLQPNVPQVNCTKPDPNHEPDTDLNPDPDPILYPDPDPNRHRHSNLKQP